MHEFLINNGSLTHLGQLTTDMAIKGAAIALVALLIVYCLRKSAAAKRHLLWALATLSLLAVPVLSLAVPRWHVELPDFLSMSAYVVASKPPAKVVDRAEAKADATAETPINLPDEALESPVPIADVNQGFTPVEEVAAPVVPEKVAAVSAVSVAEDAFGYSSADHSTSEAAVVEVITINTTPLLLFNGFALVWIVGVLLALFRPMLGYLQLHRLQHRATVIDEETRWQLFVGVRKELNIGRSVRLLCDEQIHVPLTWGFWKPTVLLPAESAHWNNNRLRMVFLHELAHVKRFDWLLQTISHLAVALHWFNPIAWHANRRLCVEQEQACDDMVISLGASACDYADELVHFSTLKPTASASALPISRESTLHQRVTRLLDGSCQRLGISGSTVLWGALCCLMLVVPLSMLTSAAQEAGTASAPGTAGAVSSSKGRHPAHLGYGNLSSFSLRTDDKVDYAFLYVGDFNSSSSFSSNTKTKSWHDDATLTTEHGKVHFTRDWTDAKHLTINGRVYQLKAGRVFVVDTVNGYPENPVQIHQVDIPVPIITQANLRTVFEAAHQPDALLTTTVGYSGAIPAESARSLRLSSYSRHDNFRTRFAFIRAVPLSDRGADVKVIEINDSNDPKKKTWQIDTTLQIGSRSYRVQNNSESPDTLLVGDQEYDLKKGQIFVSKTDGKLLQHRVRTFPIVIRDPEDLLRIYKDFDNRAPETKTEPPKMTRHTSKEFSVLAFQTKKDVAFTLYAPGFLQTGLSDSTTSEGHWTHRGVVNLIKKRNKLRQFRIYHSHREPNVLYIDGKAYALGQLADFHGNVIKPENSTSMPFKHSGRLFVLNDERDVTPLQTDRTFQFRKKTHREKDTKLINQFAQRDLYQAQHYKYNRQLEKLENWGLAWDIYNPVQHSDGARYARLRVFPDGRVVYADHQQGLLELKLSKVELAELIDKLVTHPAAKSPKDVRTTWSNWNQETNNIRIRKDGELLILKHQSKSHEPHIYPQTGMSDEQWTEVSAILFDLVKRVNDTNNQESASTAEVEPAKDKTPVTEPPSMTRHISKEFSVLAFQTEKDVVFTLYAPGLLKPELSFSEATDGAWSYQGNVKLMKDDAVSRSFKILYSHREPTTLYIDDKAYPLGQRIQESKKSGQLFVLNDERDMTPLHTLKTLPFREYLDLRTIDQWARRSLMMARAYKYNVQLDLSHQMGEMNDWVVSWDIRNPLVRSDGRKYTNLRIFADGQVVYAHFEKGLLKLQLTKQELNGLLKKLTEHPSSETIDDAVIIGPTWKQLYNAVTVRRDAKTWLLQYSKGNKQQLMSDEEWKEVEQLLTSLVDRAVAANEKLNVAKTDAKPVETKPGETKTPVSKPATTKQATTEESKASSSSDNAKWGAVYGQIVFKGDSNDLKDYQKSFPIYDRPGYKNQEENKRADKKYGPRRVIDHADNKSLIVDKETRGIKNVFVYLRRKPSRIHPAYQNQQLLKPIELTSDDHLFSPRAFALGIGQTLRLSNPSDQTVNFHSYPTRNPAFNISIAPNGKSYDWSPTRSSKKTGPPMKIVNDIFAPAKSFCLITDHPYVSITDANGKFRIDNLPAGKHLLVIWHEAFGFIDKSYALEMDGKHNVQIPTLKVTAKGLAGYERPSWSKLIRFKNRTNDARITDNQNKWRTHKRDRPFGELGFADGANGPEWEFLRLVTHQAVQEELSLNRNQMTSLKHVRKRFQEKSNQWNKAKENLGVLREEFEIARGVLTEQQSHRLAQIQLQRRGVQVFFDSELQKSLNLTKKQIDAIKKAWQTHVEKSKAGWEGDAGRKSYHNVWWIALSQLDDDQRSQFDNMTGPIVGHRI